jgi:hypothetical protein
MIEVQRNSTKCKRQGNGPLLLAAAVAALGIVLASDDRPGGEEHSPLKPLDEKILALLPEDVRWRPPPSVPAEKDAYSLWVEAGEKAAAPEDREIVSTALEEDSVFSPDDREAIETYESWIERNARAFDLVDAGLDRGDFRIPIEEMGRNWKGLAALNRTVLQAKLLQAKILTSRGKQAEAVRHLEGVLAVSDRIRRRGASMVQSLVLQSTGGLTCAVIRTVAGRPDVPAQVLERLIAALGPPERERDLFAESVRSSLFVQFSTWIPIWTGKQKNDEIIEVLVRQTVEEGRDELRSALMKLLGQHPRPLDLEDTVHRGGSIARELIAAGRGAWKDRKLPLRDEIERVEKAWPPLPWGLLTRLGMEEEEPATSEEIEDCRKVLAKIDNPIGMTYLTFHSGGNELFLKKSFAMWTNREATRAIIAIRLFALKSDGLPVSLDDLVATKVLPSVPIDPYSGKPFGYSKEKRLLWSVGLDGKEDGTGGLRDENGYRRDCIWEVPAPSNRR